ncbi:sensor protein lytS [Rudanella paleaurantiibacter]|uniref:Sensor protein lytS n=1 Tax=Rudanella paleaurantiibacter TaxID=2614655 RepID=A0A7J5TWA6_9BACT|nr:histidine kinase [Rudanella paleaurantiibacter]KAB7728730.1 sensor protein lytS [Rudanella paleaurantiibacter]
MFAHRYRYLFVALLAGYSYLNLHFLDTLSRYQITAPNWVAAGVVLAIVWLVWEGNHLLSWAIPAVQRRWPWPWHPLLIHFVLSLLLVLVVITPIVWVVGGAYEGYSLANLVVVFKLCLVFGYRVNLFINILNAAEFLFRQYRQSQLEAEQLKKTTVQAELQALKAQVNPHFLFNNFNVLSLLVDKDPASAKEFIQQLSNVYRHVLDQSNRELVSLSEEMQFLESYSYLLKTRFNGGLRIQLNVPDTYRNYYIVPAALQMVLENAIKHNVSSHNRPLTINVSVEDSPGLVVTNNVQPKTEVEGSTRVGLRNIRQRYRFITQRDVSVVQQGGTFRVTLPLIRLSKP